MSACTPRRRRGERSLGCLGHRLNWLGGVMMTRILRARLRLSSLERLLLSLRLRLTLSGESTLTQLAPGQLMFFCHLFLVILVETIFVDVLHDTVRHQVPDRLPCRRTPPTVRR